MVAVGEMIEILYRWLYTVPQRSNVTLMLDLNVQVNASYEIHNRSWNVVGEYEGETTIANGAQLSNICIRNLVYKSLAHFWDSKATHIPHNHQIDLKFVGV